MVSFVPSSVIWRRKMDPKLWILWTLVTKGNWQLLNRIVQNFKMHCFGNWIWWSYVSCSTTEKQDESIDFKYVLFPEKEIQKLYNLCNGIYERIICYRIVVVSNYWSGKYILYLVLEGRTGGVSGTIHERKKLRITDHGSKNFVFPNHENKQARNAFKNDLFLH